MCCQKPTTYLTNSRGTRRRRTRGRRKVRRKARRWRKEVGQKRSNERKEGKEEWIVARRGATIDEVSYLWIMSSSHSSSKLGQNEIENTR